MKPLATFDRLYGSPGSWKAFSSPSNRLMWVCMPDPCTPSSGLGMNVAYRPSLAAASRTTSRNVMTLSAIVRASVWRRSISCWLGASSWNEYSTGMPMASSVWMVRLRSVAGHVGGGQVEVAAACRAGLGPAVVARSEVEELHLRGDVEA